MTYCIAANLREGLVFLSDSRTNAGMDQISTFRKMTVFERPGDRLVVLMSAGNLAITQSVREILSQSHAGQTLWSAQTMAEAAEVLGQAVRTVFERDQKALAEFNIEFNCTFILGGQISGERCRLFQVYSAGNFIEAGEETPYFQIGESKYGKPILDRVLTPQTPLDEATKCALISMDSTVRSNLSVGLPLDLLVYRAGELRVGRFVTIQDDDAYFNDIRHRWGALLKDAFHSLPELDWSSMPIERSKPTLERLIRSTDQ
ncbi:MAG: hypothetical protein RLY30_919 [Pseudomonadota bacterium]|jgi:putative proteasome-type protease